DAIVAGHRPEGGHVLATQPRIAPFAVVKLSATPGIKTEDVFGLQDDDREHAVLRKRLEARKLGRLEPVDGDMAGAFVSHALSLIEGGSGARTQRKKGKREAAPADGP